MGFAYEEPWLLNRGSVTLQKRKRKMNDLSTKYASLTADKQQWYLDNSGSACPHCKSHDLDRSKPCFDDDRMWRDVTCTDCWNEWTDYYTLTSINEQVSR